MLDNITKCKIVCAVDIPKHFRLQSVTPPVVLCICPKSTPLYLQVDWGGLGLCVKHWALALHAYLRARLLCLSG